MKQRTSPLFVLVAMITAVAALYIAKGILLPISLAILITFLLTPIADRLERWRIPRIPAVVSIVAVSFALIAALGWVVAQQLVQLGGELQDPGRQKVLVTKIEELKPHSPALDRILKSLTDIRNAITQGAAPGTKDQQPDGASHESSKESNEPKENSENPPAKTETVKVDTTPSEGAKEASGKRQSTSATKTVGGKKEQLEVTVVDRPPSTFDQVEDWLSRLVEPLSTGGMIVVLVLFLLLDRENQRTRLIQLFGRTHMHATIEAVHDAAGRVGLYLRTLFLINAGYGFAVAVGLLLIGVPGAVMWGVLGFALRFVPYIGTWISATLPIVVSVALSPGWMQPILVVGWYLFIELIFNNVVEPLVYGSATGVSTIGVIISAIFWTWLWGPLGLILSMPMTVCVLVAARYVPQLKFLSVLLGDQPPATAADRTYQRLMSFDYREPLKLAHQKTKETSLAKYYDDVLIPTLSLIEQDRHSDLLTDEQSSFVLEAAEDMVQELGEAERRKLDHERAKQIVGTPDAESPAGPLPSTARVLCIPLRDIADEITCRMLAQLLVAQDFQVDVGAAHSLTSELVEQVADTDAEVVVISVLPPVEPRDSRLLWRRLRSRYPHLPIIVGFWTATTERDSLAEPVEDAASQVVTSFAEAIAAVRVISTRAKVAAKTA